MSCAVSGALFAAELSPPAPSASPAGTQPTLTLQETIQAAVARNTQVRNAYLDRVVQSYDLYVAESKFTPRFSLEAALNRNRRNENAAQRNVDAAIQATQILPTGAQITLRNAQTTLYSLDERDRSRGWTLAFEQPLLKGGGLDFATASVRVARLAEQRNILQLKATLTSTVVSTVRVFRTLVQNHEALEINRQSLQRSRDVLEINRELIAAKRMAQHDIMQSEADVARREVDLLSAENTLDAARLALVSLANLDIFANPIPVAETEVPTVSFNRARALEIAFKNRTDFQAAQLGLESLRIEQALARNGLLWMLNLVGGYGSSQVQPRDALSYRDKDVNVGLRLVIPFNDPSLKQAVISSDVRIEQAERNLAQQRLDITVEVDNALRQTAISRRQIDLARQSRTLSEKNLENVTEKLKVGRATNFELVSYQNQLVEAQRGELAALIGYLNDVTNLEQTLGIVLEKWGIDLVER